MVLNESEHFTCIDQGCAKLNIFHNKNLRSLLKRDEIRNVDLYRITASCSIENYYVRRYRMRWAGYLRRIKNDRIPKRVLLAELNEGKL